MARTQRTAKTAPVNRCDEDILWQRIVHQVTDESERELLHYLYQGLLFAKEDSFMLRCRMTGGELSCDQLMGLASIAELYGSGYADVTTRANFQIRGVAFDDGIQVLRELVKLEIVPSVKGLNNLRNITVTPTSGFDPHEVVDVTSIAKALTQALLFQPALQGLPGKFNIAVDSGGSISVASEANDAGVRAVEVDGEIHYRVSYANVRGDEVVSEDAGWLLKEEQVVAVVSAMISVFLENGDFSKRLRSRLKYYVASVGKGAFLQQVKDRVIFELIPTNTSNPAVSRGSGLQTGINIQKQKGFSYICIQGATGRYTSGQLRELAKVAKNYGRSTVRLTTQQSCMIPWISDENIDEAKEKLSVSGLWLGTKFEGTIVACTGNVGCSYSATNTKLHAKELRETLEMNAITASGVNIHFTGCPFSCAQAYIGDIGLMGAKEKGEECYHIFVGGGADQNMAARKLIHAASVGEMKASVVTMLNKYESSKRCGENFYTYVSRVGLESLSKNQEVKDV